MPKKFVLGDSMVATELPPKEGSVTRQFVVTDRSEGVLGAIKWFNHWRRYTFAPNSETTFDAKCMRDLATFLDRLMKEHVS